MFRPHTNGKGRQTMSDEDYYGGQVEPGTELTIPSVAGATSLSGLVGKTSGYLTSMSVKTPEEREFAFKLMTQDQPALDQALNNKIKLVHWLVSVGEFTDTETGELITGPIIRLITDTGTVYQTWSASVARQIATYHEQVRPAPWNPPLTVTPRRKPLKRDGKKSFYTLEF